MKKWLIYLLCAALAACILATPDAAAGETPLRPVSVRESAGDSPRMEKVYELALTDTERRIPTGDFTQGGFLYHLVEMTRENKVGVDTKEYTEAVTKDCPSNETEAALKALDAERTVSTPDGYQGKLLLDHASVKVSVKGYKTSSKNVTASRVFPHLADADLSLIPKSISENGNVLTLNDAQWEGVMEEDGSLTFTATAQYSGTSTSRRATGYTVSANYVGNVVKTSCDMIVYTAIFQGERIPTPPDAPEVEEPAAIAASDGASAPEAPVETESLTIHDWLAMAGCGGGIMTAAAVLYECRLKRNRRRASIS